MAGRRQHALAAAAALALLASCCLLAQHTGSAVELAAGVNSHKMSAFAEGLVGKNLPVENLATPYETGFPRVVSHSILIAHSMPLPQLMFVFIPRRAGHSPSRWGHAPSSQPATDPRQSPRRATSARRPTPTPSTRGCAPGHRFSTTETAQRAPNPAQAPTGAASTRATAGR